MKRFAFAITSRAELRSWRTRLTWLAFLISGFAGILSPTSSRAETTNYVVRGVVKGVKQDEHQLLIAHEAIPNFMEAMTMRFNIKEDEILNGVAPGDKVTFQLHITDAESWIDHIEKLDLSHSVAHIPVASKSDLHELNTNSAATGHSENPLRNYKFTNELGQQVSLSDFRGQAIALTFFFTRCPIPEFCPRLSRNFQEVQRKLCALENAPTNWRLLSVTFDPAHDTPQVLRAYAASYQYDPKHWSFLTGPLDKISEFARLCDVKFDPDNGLINHNFRTLIIDASNRLQMVFPTSGDISEALVQELLKAARATNQIAKAAGSYRSESDQ
jgi:protein SCO1/2